MYGVCSLMYNLEIVTNARISEDNIYPVQDWSVAHKYNFRPRLLVVWHMEDIHGCIYQFAIVKNDMRSPSCKFP